MTQKFAKLEIGSKIQDLQLVDDIKKAKERQDREELMGSVNRETDRVRTTYKMNVYVEQLLSRSCK